MTCSDNAHASDNIHASIDAYESAAESDSPVPFWKLPRGLNRFRRRLMGWFAKNRRIFPWRESRDPYAVWVSETMLQQTTTETVLGYYHRFLDRFPTAADLAAAAESEVLTYWQGLGYYRRAVQMYRCAQEITAHYGGRFPDSVAELQSLPGIGRYTAGAVRSFAFDLPAPILEANTARLYARLIALEEEFSSSSARNRLWNLAEQLIPKKSTPQIGAGDFNQALIDLGNGVCTQNNPKCADCPVFEFCAAHRLGLTDKIPVRKGKEEKIYKREVALLIPRSALTAGGSRRDKRTQDRYLFVRYPEKLRWAGLWDFPRFETAGDCSPAEDAGLHEKLKQFFGCPVRLSEPIAKIRHTVTRYKIDLFFCRVDFAPLSEDIFAEFCRRFPKIPIPFAGGTASAGKTESVWERLDTAQSRPFNSTARRLLAAARKLEVFADSFYANKP